MKLYFENLLGFLLAVLIVFEFKVEENIRAFMNTVVGMVCCIVLVIYMFMFFNPLVAILFLVYFYENVRLDGINSNMYDLNTRPNTMSTLQSSVENVANKKDVVEIETIKKMAPIIKKRENMTAIFKPNDYNKNTWTTL
jgi:hypothetical protein